MKIIVLFALVLLPLPLCAAPRTFTGNGPNTNWSTTANWNPTGEPTAADSLVFIAGASPSNNNLSGATFRDFDFNARHVLTGNAFTLTHGMTASALQGVTISQNITLGAAQNWNIGSGSMTCGGTLALNAHVLTVSGAGTLALATVTGAGASQIQKNGPVTLRISTIAANAAGIDVNGGTLDVAGIVTGPVRLFNIGRLIGNGQCQGEVTATRGEIVPTDGDLSFANTLTLSSQTKVIVSLTGPGAEHHVNVTGGAVNLNDAELVMDTTAYQPVWNEDFTLLSKTSAGLVTGMFKDLDQGDEVRVNDTTVGRISYTGGNGNDVVIDIISTTRTWDGGHAVNDNWDQPENWSANLRPNFGDVLVFPPGIQSSDRGVDNNFPNNTTFRQLVVNGDDFTLRGNPLQLSHGIVLAFPQDVDGQFNLDTTITLAADQTFDFRATVSGGVLTGLPTLHLDLLDEINTNGKNLALLGDGFLNGRISGSGRVTIEDGARIGFLGSDNAYTGLTFIGPHADLQIRSERGLGLPNAGTEIAGRLEFSTLIDRQFDEPFTMLDGGAIHSQGTDFITRTKLRGSMHFSPGSSTLSSLGFSDRTEGKHDLEGTLTGPGDLLLEGSWTINGTGNNTANGSLVISEGTLTLAKSTPGALAAAFGTITVTNAVAGLVCEADEQIVDTADVVLNFGDLDLGTSTGHTETIKNLTLTRADVIGAAGSVLGITGDITSTASGFGGNEASIEVTLRIEGHPTIIQCTGGGDSVDDLQILSNVIRPDSTASILRTGGGRVVFSGLLALPCELQAGDTLFNGISGTSAVMRLNGGTIGGTGTVGNILSLAGGGTVAPGQSTGTLSCRNVSWNGATRLKTEIGVANLANGYDKLVATGTVTLGNATVGFATLEVTELPTSGIPMGFQMIILENDASDPISGNFAGREEGSFIPLPSGGGLIISYKGTDGAGNDVVLTKVSGPPVTPQLIAMSLSKGTGPGGQDVVSLGGTAGPGAVVTLQASINLVTWTDVQTVTADGSGTLIFSVNHTPGLPRRFFRPRP